MFKNTKHLFTVTLALFFITSILQAQTNGTLTFTYTQVAHSPCYSGTRNVLAVWIQNSTGGFVKTKSRNVGNSTKDHLPTWAVNSGGAASNALGTGCNVTDATTGATLASFSTHTITWDGKNVSGSSNGTFVADGIYKVTLQETWNHGTTSTTTRSYTFTKGPNPDHQTPPNDADFKDMTLDWIPGTAGIEGIDEPLSGVEVYPNPSNDGLVNVKFEKAKNIQVTNLLGAILLNENIENGSGIKVLDLSHFANGVYFIAVSDNGRYTRQKVILNR